MEKVILPFGKFFTCPKCGATDCGIEWVGSNFDAPEKDIIGIYEDEYTCNECGCHFINTYKVDYNCTYVE